MKKPEILWRTESGAAQCYWDIASFCRSFNLDSVTLDLNDESGVYVSLGSATYNLSNEQTSNCFSCPDCGKTLFQVAEGILDGAAAIGMLCDGCGSYGVLFPNGM